MMLLTTTLTFALSSCADKNVYQGPKDKTTKNSTNSTTKQFKAKLTWKLAI